MPHDVASDLGLHCLPMNLLRVSRFVYDLLRVLRSIGILSKKFASLLSRGHLLKEIFAPLGANIFLQD